MNTEQPTPEDLLQLWQECHHAPLTYSRAVLQRWGGQQRPPHTTALAGAVLLLSVALLVLVAKLPG